MTVSVILKNSHNYKTSNKKLYLFTCLLIINKYIYIYIYTYYFISPETLLGVLVSITAHHHHEGASLTVALLSGKGISG